MRNRRFFWLSIIAGLVALVLLSAARGVFDRASKIKVAQIHAAIIQQVSYTPDPEAAHLSQAGHILNGAGLTLVAFSIVFLSVASIRRESGWYLMAILLLFFDFMAYLTLS